MPVASHHGVTRAPAGVQGGRAQAFHACSWVSVARCLLLAVWLGGCSSEPKLSSMNPEDWWHDLEGGTVAQIRPPPPNADAPYPSLKSVPAKPPAPDAAAHAKITSTLLADRTNAIYAASADPIPVLPPPPAHPVPPPATSGSDDQPNASLPAANAPPPPPPPPAPPPTTTAGLPPNPPYSQAVVPANEGPSPPHSPAVPVPPPAATPSEQMTQMPSGPMPQIPDGPPQPPRIAGVNVPLVVTPTPPPATPPPGPPPTPVAGKPVAIPFPPGSAVVPVAAKVPIQQVVGQRGPGTVNVVGFGDGDFSDPAAQAAALPLALERARAVAAALRAAGVPNTAIRIAADPLGKGAAATVVR